MTGISIRTKGRLGSLRISASKTRAVNSGVLQPRLLKDWVCPSFPNSVFRDITLGAWNPLWWEYFHRANAANHSSPFPSLRVNLPETPAWDSWSERDKQPGPPGPGRGCKVRRKQDVQWGLGWEGTAMQCFSKWGPGELMKNTESQSPCPEFPVSWSVMGLWYLHLKKIFTFKKLKKNFFLILQ